MKKLVLGVALMGLLVSCKKIQAGSNHGLLKLEDGVERYSDDAKKAYAPEPVDSAKTTVTPALPDSTAALKAESPEAAKAAAPSTDTAPAAQPK